MSNDPLARLPAVPSFEVTSTDVADGERWAAPQMSKMMGVDGGEDTSPALAWRGAPDTTKSYAVTIYDPDAPTQSGFWHWAVANIPASVTSLPAGAGSESGDGLPDGAIQYANDAGGRRFVGAAPPPGPEHRYFVVVHALDVDDLGVPAGATPAFLNFNFLDHIVGRAVLVAMAKQ